MGFSSTSSLSMVMSLVYGFGTLVSVAGQIVLIVTVAGVVKRNRPDAFGTLLAWAAGSLGATIFFSIAGTIGPVIAGRSSVEAMFTFQIVISALHMPVNIALFAALALGLARLARPPVEPLVRGEPPYR